MSEVKVNKVSPRSGTTVTIGDSGDTINIVGTLQNNGSPLAGDISSVVAGTGLSGGATSGVATLNIEAAQPTITSLGTLTGLTITGTGVVTTFKSTNNNTVLRLKGSNATNGGALGSTSSGDLTFLENLSEGMRLTSTGLGIGTTSPANNLHIFTDASGEGILVKSTGNTYNDIIGDSNRSGAGNNLVRFRGNWNGNGVAMIALSAGDDTTNKDDGRIEFFTSASGSSQNNRMVIEPNGNVGIGTTSPDDRFHVMRGDSGGTTRGGSVITAENSGNCFVTFLGASTSNCTLFLGDNLNNNAGQLDYDHANDSMSFYTNQSEKVRIDSSGSVGIGTTAPFNSRPGSFTISNEAPTIYMEDTNSSGSGVGQILYSNGDLAYSTGTRNGTSTSNSTEHFRIKNDGKVGIGITSPASLLHISGTSPQMSFTETDQSDKQYRIGSFGAAYGVYDVSVGQYRHIIDTNGNHIFNEGGLDCDFRVEGANETHSLFVEGSSGRVKMNTSSSSTPQPTLEVTSFGGTLPSVCFHGGSSTSSGSILIFRNGSGSEVGGVSMSNLNAGSSISFNTSSDYRLKENIVEITDATTRLKQLKPKRFNFIADPNKTVDGFIAHEVSDIVPEAITKEKDAIQLWTEGEELPEGVSVGDNKLDADGNTIPDYQGIDQSKLVPLLVKTIQELEARITTLENA